jgi:error-prone DNA polymerase
MYAELVCRSNFSFQHGASHPHELVQRAKVLGYSALALTDECSLAGVVRAHVAAKECGLKLLIGSQFQFTEGDRLILVATSQNAYTQICTLISRARCREIKGSYAVTRNDFMQHISECLALWLPPKNCSAETIEWFATLPAAAKALGFVHALEQDAQARYRQLCELRDLLQIPITATGDVHYHERSRRPLHDVLTAIRLKTPVSQIGQLNFINGERHLRPLSTLQKLYPAETLQTAAALAEKCDFSLSSLRYEYPHELVPPGTTASKHLRQLTLAGCQRRWPGGTPASVIELIEKELALIAELQYESYFLTVEELVRFARSRGILCQGRGSAANSAVCYALGVTEVDPARIALLFERFISKERHEPPDIDIDFEHQRREEVIQHVFNKYGRERAALAATVITYRRRSALRDVGAALGISSDVISKLNQSVHYFDDPQETVQQLQRLGLQTDSRTVQLWLQLSAELRGFPRHLSQHVGGFVISEQPLSHLVPIENAAMPARTIIQWDKEDLESLGLLKVDCLALGMLSAIRNALQLKSIFTGESFQMQDVPPEDPETYDMLCAGEALGVFQIESRAQMSMLPRLKPREFWDLVVQIAIVRPGPIQGGMVHPYLRRRQGLEPIDYPSEELKKILHRTFGVPLFQEQVMEIAIHCAGFSAGEADQIRRSMAAWQRRGGLDHFEHRLKSGMQARGYSAEFAERIYQQILGFGSYGFPLAHSASFALLAYVSAWLRCHEHPAFLAGLLNSQPMGFYAAAQLINDAKRHGVNIRNIAVDCSAWECTLEPDENGKAAVRLGFKMIRGIAQQDIQRLLLARTERHFTSVQDLAHRAALSQQTLEKLAQADALTPLVAQRRQAYWTALGHERLPGMLAGHAACEPPVTLPPLSAGEAVLSDYQAIGLTLGQHPLALLRSRLAKLKTRRAIELLQLKENTLVRIAGLVTHRQRPQTASGVLFMSLEDETGLINLVIWPQVQVSERLAVLESQLLVADGMLQKQSNVIHIIVRRAYDYSNWLGALKTVSRDFC